MKPGKTVIRYALAVLLTFGGLAAIVNNFMAGVTLWHDGLKTYSVLSFLGAGVVVALVALVVVALVKMALEAERELKLKACSARFQVGVNKGDCLKITMPTTIIDIFDEPIGFSCQDV